MKPTLKCPECKSKNVLYKKTTNTYWCRRCGNEWTKKGDKKCQSVK